MLGFLLYYRNKSGGLKILQFEEMKSYLIIRISMVVKCWYNIVPQKGIITNWR